VTARGHRQPWSTGKIGLCGVSYYAMTQWLAAARQPPHLAAITAWEGAQDFYPDVTHHGDISSSLFPRMWYQRRVRSARPSLVIVRSSGCRWLLCTHL
jgi:hypothetical protein